MPKYNVLGLISENYHELSSEQPPPKQERDKITRNNNQDSKYQKLTGGMTRE